MFTKRVPIKVKVIVPSTLLCYLNERAIVSLAANFVEFFIEGEIAPIHSVGIPMIWMQTSTPWNQKGLTAEVYQISLIKLFELFWISMLCNSCYFSIDFCLTVCLFFSNSTCIRKGANFLKICLPTLKLEALLKGEISH